MIHKFTVPRWCEVTGMDEADIAQDYGTDVKAFYANNDSPCAGCEHANGTYDVFGCRIDVKGLTYEQMKGYLEER